MLDADEAVKLVQDAMKGSGLDTVPLSDEALRPLALAMQRLGRRKAAKVGVIVFDLNQGPPVNLFLGIPCRIAESVGIAKELADMPEAKALMSADKKGVLLIAHADNGMAVVYSEKLFIPVAALGKRRN